MSDSTQIDVIDFSDEAIDETPEAIVMEDGTECQLRIIDMRFDTDKNGKPYMLPRFEVLDEPLASDFTKFLKLPGAAETDKERVKIKRALKNFAEAFQLDFTGTVDKAMCIGATGYALLGIENSDEYGEQNYVRKFVI